MTAGTFLQRNVEYHLQRRCGPSAKASTRSWGKDKRSSRLFAARRDLKVGPAIEALEREAPGLGATFYWILTYALHRILRVYNNTMISSTRNACRSTPSRTERDCSVG